jgi:hypothetical protein
VSKPSGRVITKSKAASDSSAHFELPNHWHRFWPIEDCFEWCHEKESFPGEHIQPNDVSRADALLTTLSLMLAMGDISGFGTDISQPTCAGQCLIKPVA